ncbi:hypothetical protein NQ024_15365, partial [Corynebacterium sp. 35RC1]|nr:hypothetical protein [Corynebacterium sp. 35RC1]
MADGDALHIARTKASSVVGLSEDTRKQADRAAGGRSCFLVRSVEIAPLRSAERLEALFGASSLAKAAELLE